MRSLILALALNCLLLPSWTPLLAEPGTEAERVSRPSNIEEGYGAVVVSIRSELFLEDTLGVYFLREGGDVANDADVTRFERRQGFFAFGNDTLGFEVRTFQLPPGTYRLVAHGVSCPKIPSVDERCLVDRSGLGGTEEISRPSRGYSEIAPTFEVLAGQVTYAGDFILTARNTIEWAEIPFEELRRTRSRFGEMPSAPEPIIPGEFRLRYGLTPRSLEDDWNRRY